MSEEETTAGADARKSRDLVFSAALQLATKVIEHVDEFGLAAAVMDEKIECGSYEWHVQANYGKGHSFVAVSGHPCSSMTGFVTMEDLAEIMGNQSAQFTANVPRAWIELAAHAATEIP